MLQVPEPSFQMASCLRSGSGYTESKPGPNLARRWDRALPLACHRRTATKSHWFGCHLIRSFGHGKFQVEWREARCRHIPRVQPSGRIRQRKMGSAGRSTPAQSYHYPT